ncbi:MAG TPA: hypothetical protein ENF23_05255 [Methanosarcinales archaeon]|nr:MAG: hypothetical protein DRO03_09155 [Methanosarcinales archaeon]HDN65687.1 hypothetical protein [Methanosarcinales archaeon]
MSEQESTKSQKYENGKETLWTCSIEHLLKKERITVWITLPGTFALGFKGVLKGVEVIEVIKRIGTFWFGAEAGITGSEARANL